MIRLFSIGLLLALLGLSGLARGDTGLLLARVCMSEADAHAGNDCPAIDEVTRNRASRTGRTYVQQLRAYSPEATGTRPTSRPRLRWIAALTRSAERPEHYPAHLRWEPYREAWLRRLSEADGLLEHPRRVCQRPPHHWGMRRGEEGSAPLRRGWVLVDCGVTVNAFWRVP